MENGKELSRIARFVAERISELQGIRNQREVAQIAGYTNPNMITMIKQGMTKVSVDRVMDLAKALDTDPAPLMRMALEQFYTPQALKDLERNLGAILLPDERRVLDTYRAVRDQTAPALVIAKLPEDLDKRLTAIFNH